MRMLVLVAAVVIGSRVIGQVESAPTSREKAPPIPADTEIKTTSSGLKSIRAQTRSAGRQVTQGE